MNTGTMTRPHLTRSAWRPHAVGSLPALRAPEEEGTPKALIRLIAQIAARQASVPIDVDRRPPC
jgi:hypothetical protein